MPETRFRVRWPDDTREVYYSPSLVVCDYLAAGTAYRVNDFVERSRAALAIASERVREKYGFPCSRAARALEQIEAKARALGADSDGAVCVESFTD